MNPYFSRVLRLHPDLKAVLPDLESAFATLVSTFENERKLLLCGNGGSAADCEHIAAELVNKFERARPLPPALQGQLRQQFGAEGEFLAAQLQGALPAISLVSQTAMMTALANDVAAEGLFAQQVWAYGQRGDCLMALSTSGHSSNVLHALRVARMRGLTTVGFTGRGGGAMVGLCDVCLVVPRHSTAEIQEAHLPLYHALCGALEERFFGGAQSTQS